MTLSATAAVVPAMTLSGGVSGARACGRVEDLLLDAAVDGQLLDDLVDDLLLGLRSVRTEPFEPLEQLLDLLVILFEQDDGVRRHGDLPRSVFAWHVPGRRVRETRH